MRLTEDIVLTKHYYGPAGSRRETYSITDKPVDELVDNLREQGLEINSDYSEKEVKYRARTGPRSSIEKTATVPLATEFPNGASSTAFYLRDGSGLELELRNYDNITQSPPSGVIGGIVAGDFGIVCKLSTEGRTVDLSVIDKVREAMKKTY